jgi:hypothetical protein
MRNRSTPSRVAAEVVAQLAEQHPGDDRLAREVGERDRARVRLGVSHERPATVADLATDLGREQDGSFGSSEGAFDVQGGPA